MQIFTQYKETQTAHHEGFELMAYTRTDEFNNEAPDEGLWPSLQQLREANARMKQYENGDLYAIGVTVKVFKAGVELAESSLWGMWSDDAEEYLLQVANEQAIEAIEAARAKLIELAA